MRLARQALGRVSCGSWLLLALVVASAWWAVSSILHVAGGEPSVPLDDAYIHFQFARAFSNFTPFVYSPDSAPVPGATSLLWPALLAPSFWLGLGGVDIVWVAWLLGFSALALLTFETHALSKQLLSPGVAWLTAAMVPCFGGLVWLAGSGMEAVPFAWLWLRGFRRASDWWRAGGSSVWPSALGKELLALGVLAPLMRPEGALVSLVLSALIAIKGTGRQRALLVVPLSGALLPRLLMWLGTGSLSSTTSSVKWLLHQPYLDARQTVAQIFANLRLLYGTLLNGEIWSASVLPTGSALVTWGALPALAVLAYRKRRYAAGLACLFAALGLWIPTTYDTFLWNRLRYLWPFAPAWFIGAGALCDLLGDAATRWKRRWGAVRHLLAALVLVALASKLPVAVDDLATSSFAIQQQQASLGRWAREHLPGGARIGVNDTGAIAYFSGHPIFDVVGLTTVGEAEHWVAGAGSRFEHYERLPARSLPTHFVVYPEWFALDPLLGQRLTERIVHATILGGTRMVAYRADYSSLLSAQRPVLVDVSGRKLVDELDVADLVSEHDHRYELLDARQEDDRIFTRGDWVDGGRANRTLERFRLRAVSGGLIVVRVCATEPSKLTLKRENQPIGTLSATHAWDEQVVELPPSQKSASLETTLEIEGAPVGVLHYFSYGPPLTRARSGHPKAAEPR